MPTGDIFPTKDRDFHSWQNNFYTRVQTNLAAWLIPVSMFNLLAPFKMEWDAAWLVAENKENRTPADVARKKTAKAKYITALRAFVAGCINYNKTIPDEQRLKIGVKIHDTTHTNAPVPDSLPQMTASAGKGNQVLVYFEQEPDESGTSLRAKPAHVQRIEVCYKIGGEAPGGTKNCPNMMIATRSPMKLNFEEEDAGKVLYFYGRWVNTRNEPGQWTAKPLTITIP